MKLSQWKGLFSPHILQRGESYYEEGCVESLEWDKNSIHATVLGSEHYTVEIVLKQGRISDWYCSCPYAEDGTPCKHLAAVCYALEDEKNEELEEPSKASTPLNEIVARLTLSEAQALLLKLAAEYGEVADLIRMTKEPPFSGKLRNWESKVDQILSKAAGWDDYIEYERAWEAMCDMEEFVTSTTKHLMESGHIWDAFSLTGYAFCAVAGYEMDDSDGGFTMFGDACFSLWEEQVAAASAEE